MKSSYAPLIAWVALLLAVLGISFSVAAAEKNPPVVGDWIIDEDVTYTQSSGYVEGSIIVNGAGCFSVLDSSLLVNHSIVLERGASMLVRNSTISFNCTPIYNNVIQVNERATLTISDKDGDRETKGDRSVITSATSLNYNITVLRNSTFSLRNSLISQCGRYGHDTNLEVEEGLLVRSQLAIVDGTEFTDGYYGLILDESEGVRVDNCTFVDNHVGIFMRGTKDCMVEACTILDSVDYGMEVRGFQGDLTVTRCTVEGSGEADIYAQFSSGYQIAFSEITLGGGSAVGLRAEDIDSFTFRDVTVRGASEAVNMTDPTCQLHDLTVENCTRGLGLFKGGAVTLDNPVLLNTTVLVESEVSTKLNYLRTGRLLSVVGELGCNIVLNDQAKLTIDSCDLQFLDRSGGPTGIEVVRGGSLTLRASTVGADVSGRWLFSLRDGSLAHVTDCTLKQLGNDAVDPGERGMLIAGSGTLRDVTITDSLCGLVFGRSSMEVTELAITRCQVGILVDGALGRGGAELSEVSISDCDRVAIIQGSGSLTLAGATVNILTDGFLVTGSSDLTLKDSTVDDPPMGHHTAELNDTSTVNLVNCSSSREFSFGTGNNVVNVKWYLDLTVVFLTDDTPVAGALVDVQEVSGATVSRGVDAGPDGIVQHLEMRELSLTPQVVQGTPHVVTVRHGDLSDHFNITMDSSKAFLFKLDNYPPVLDVTYPANRTLLSGSNVTFTGRAYDAMETEHKGLEKLRYRVDGGAWTQVPLPEVIDWSFDVTLEDGDHVITVEVVDLLGNRRAVSVFVTVDTTAPSLQVLSPDPQVLTNSSSLVIEGRTEPGAVVEVDGTSVEVSGVGDFTHTVTLVEGANAIQVTASDENGNQRLVVINAVLDTVPPVVVVDQGLEIMTNASTITLTGTKESNTSLELGGERPELFESTEFSIELELVEGVNTFGLISEDMAGNLWHRTIVVTVDTTPPALNVQSLGGYTRFSTVNVQGTVDSADASVTVNGLQVTLAGLAFTKQVSLVEGSNTITVRAVDPFGNVAGPVTLEVVLDTMTPSLTVTTPKVVSTVSDKHNITGTAEPGATVVVSVSKEPYSETYNKVVGEDGAFDIQVLMPLIGSYSVTVTVEDEAGNRATDSLSIERERAEPPDGGGGDGGGSWLEDNWVWIVIVVLIIAAVGMQIIIRSGPRRGPPSAVTTAKAAPERTLEDVSVDEPGEGDAVEEEDEEDEGDREEEEDEEEEEEQRGREGPSEGGDDDGDEVDGWEEEDEERDDD